LPEPHLTVQLHHRVGTLNLDVAFQLTQPWTILFGPSGSGKTTILRAIAGLVRPSSGRITHRATTLSDSTTNAFVPPHNRPIRLATQTPNLFPHLTLQQNLLYGAGWLSKPEDRNQLAENLLALLHLSDLSHHLPHQLSGGEQQRASLARALLSATTCDGPTRPLLLLDEPFTGLEATLRDQLLEDLSGWATCWEVPILSVTHDIAEAFQLNAEVLKLANGRITHQGPATTVLAADRTRLLAQLTQKNS
jgi:molybdate transport system ATP-binding protein